MKKKYESPFAEEVEFDPKDLIMTATSNANYNSEEESGSGGGGGSDEEIPTGE